MEEVPGAHQAERVVASHNHVALGHQDALTFLKYRVWIFLKFNYMWKDYNVDAIRRNGHRVGVPTDGGTPCGGEDDARLPIRLRLRHGLRFPVRTRFGCVRPPQPGTVLDAGRTENRQVVAGADDQQVVSEYIGNQWDEATVLDIEHEAPRHTPMPVGKASAAVRKILHATTRAESGSKVYRIEIPAGGGARLPGRSLAAAPRPRTNLRKALGIHLSAHISVLVV